MVKKYFMIILTIIIIFNAFSNPVTTWVPPYSIPQCKTMLQKDFGGVGMKDGLTYLPLQFYKPNGDQLVKAGNIADSDIQWFINWGKTNNIKVLLCIYNYINDWDWNAARTSFLTNRNAFVRAVLSEVQRLGFDGVDIDFEGPDVSTQDRDAYIAFAKDLCDSLHPKNKIVTIASFPAQWNAPNWDWWTPLFNTAKVDGICSMGYDWSGKNKDYAAQVQHASAAPSKFMIGMPGWVTTWQGNNVSEQLDWIITNGVVGIGIWDATLSGGGLWQSAEVWNKIKRIRQMGQTSVNMPIANDTKIKENITIVSNMSNGITAIIRAENLTSASAKIYDISGKLVAVLDNSSYSHDGIKFEWNGTDMSGNKSTRGSYIISFDLNGKKISKGFILTK
jgi:hypothetical protein